MLYELPRKPHRRAVSLNSARKTQLGRSFVCRLAELQVGRERKGEKMRERRGWRVLRRGLKTGERIFFRTAMCNRVLQEDTIP